MSTNTYLIDASTRHAVFVQRFAGGEVVKAERLLKRMRREILARLADEPTEFRYTRLKSLLADVDATANELMIEFADDVKAMRDDFVISEAEFYRDMYGNATSATWVLPTDQQLITAATTVSFQVGSKRLTVDQALDAFGRDKKKQITQLISDSVILGDSVQTTSKKVSELTGTLIKRQAEALVRTSVNHLSSVAREGLYSANADILDGYEWVSTLDSRTTIICAGRDGIVFEIGRGDPMPPAHWQCRSTTVPSVKKEYTISGIKGERPALGDMGKVNVSGKSTYSGWLKRQGSDFQDEVLGPARAKLFRKGQIELTGFVDPTGRVYTLIELRAMNPMALG